MQRILDSSMSSVNATVASAPGKLILFGEHAVVHARLAVASCLSDLRMFVVVVRHCLLSRCVPHAVDWLRRAVLCVAFNNGCATDAGNGRHRERDVPGPGTSTNGNDA